MAFNYKLLGQTKKAVLKAAANPPTLPPAAPPAKPPVKTQEEITAEKAMSKKVDNLLGPPTGLSPKPVAVTKLKYDASPDKYKFVGTAPTPNANNKPIQYDQLAQNPSWGNPGTADKFVSQQPFPTIAQEDPEARNKAFRSLGVNPENMSFSDYAKSIPAQMGIPFQYATPHTLNHEVEDEAYKDLISKNYSGYTLNGKPMPHRWENTVITNNNSPKLKNPIDIALSKIPMKNVKFTLGENRDQVTGAEARLYPRNLMDYIYNPRSPARATGLEPEPAPVFNNSLDRAKYEQANAQNSASWRKPENTNFNLSLDNAQDKAINTYENTLKDLRDKAFKDRTSLPFYYSTDAPFGAQQAQQVNYEPGLTTDKANTLFNTPVNQVRVIQSTKFPSALKQDKPDVHHMYNTSLADNPGTGKSIMQDMHDVFLNKKPLRDRPNVYDVTLEGGSGKVPYDFSTHNPAAIDLHEHVHTTQFNKPWKGDPHLAPKNRQTYEAELPAVLSESAHRAYALNKATGAWPKGQVMGKNWKDFVQDLVDKGHIGGSTQMSEVMNSPEYRAQIDSSVQKAMDDARHRIAISTIGDVLEKNPI
jgi:hypothetical protein